MKRLLAITSAVLAVTTCVAQTSVSVPFDKVKWEYDDPAGVEFIEHLGQKAVLIKRGLAYLKDVELKDGVIEADVAPPAPRTFEGLVFRYDGKENGEQVYLRYHKSNQADAVQYDPIFRREATWQLYPDYQASKKWPENKWIHIKIEFYKDKAKVYFEHESTPTLYIDDLKTDRSSGKIGVNGQFGAYFANFKYTPGIEGTEFEKSFVSQKKTYPKAIREYEISDGFQLEKGALPDIKTAQTTSWEKITLTEEGLIDIPKYRDKKISGNFEENSDDYIWIRLKINSDKETVKSLKFDFTNKAYIYLNKQQLFEGNNSFRHKGLLFRGEIDKQAEANRIYLPLKKGENEILIAVSSVANGWGWIAKWGE